MATFAIYIDKSQKRRDGDYPVSIRITQWRKHAYLPTGYYVCSEQMSKDFEL
ncbi:Arm DNA-binding domain-containing protein [Butyricimonas paravirosa]